MTRNVNQINNKNKNIFNSFNYDRANEFKCKFTRRNKTKFNITLIKF